MKVLFWGTPEFALPSLAALEAGGHRFVGVVTRPDRPRGRGRKTSPSPVRRFAEARGYRVLTPPSPRSQVFLDEVRAMQPEISVVVAYGRILARELLELPARGSINVHASLLPALRGAAPINWAIVRGEERTGITIMRMSEEMDAGPILARAPETIGPEDTASDLSGRLSELGARLLVAALDDLAAGRATETEQDHALATYAPKVSRESARIDWSQDARSVANLIRGMDAVPGAWTLLAGKPVKMFRPGPSPLEGPRSAAPGTILEVAGGSGLTVATGTGTVAIGEVQPPGKRRMAAADWMRGRGASVGDRFE